MKVAAEAAESARLIAAVVLTATGLRVGVPESLHATSQPIETPHPAYVTVEMAVEVMAITAKPHPAYAMVEMAVEVMAITAGANAAVATTFAGTDDSKLGVPESRSTSMTDTTTAIVAGFAGGRELLEVLTGGADIANAVTGGEPTPRETTWRPPQLRFARGDKAGVRRQAAPGSARARKSAAKLRCLEARGLLSNAILS